MCLILPCGVAYCRLLENGPRTWFNCWPWEVLPYVAIWTPTAHCGLSHYFLHLPEGCVLGWSSKSSFFPRLLVLLSLLLSRTVPQDRDTWTVWWPIFPLLLLWVHYGKVWSCLKYISLLSQWRDRCSTQRTSSHCPHVIWSPGWRWIFLTSWAEPPERPDVRNAQWPSYRGTWPSSWQRQGWRWSERFRAIRPWALKEASERLSY